MDFLKKLLLIGVFFIGVSLFTKPAFAMKYDLIPPDGTLTRGEPVQFVIAIDTEGATITTTQVGMTYDTHYLQYVNVVPGDAVTSVTVNEVSPGNLLFTGTNTQGFAGQGDFAYVNFTLIATAPGETELCILYAPPTSSTPAPTAPAGATSAPVPTGLPKTGETFASFQSSITGLLLVIISFSILMGVRKWQMKTVHSHKSRRL